MGLMRLGRAAVTALREVAMSGMGYARIMAIHALGNIGGEEAVELLTSLASDAYEQVQVAANEALAELTQEKEG
ncbi:MAG: HEAT repeat domain-containing protein [Janthinobacterium lividum]